jgi:hypothetical protein
MQRFRDVTHIPRQFSEVWNQEFGDQMEHLRENVDRPLREIAMGERSTPNFYRPTGLSLKENLSQLRTNFKAGHFVKALWNITDIGNMAAAIAVEVGDLTKRRSDWMSGFYGQHEYSPQEMQKMQQFFKGAALEDLFEGFSRGRVRKLLERAYSNRTKTLVQEIGTLKTQAEGLAKLISRSFRDMGEALVQGDIGKYIATLKRIDERQKEFETTLREKYNNPDTGIAELMAGSFRAEDEEAAKPEEEAPKPGEPVVTMEPGEAPPPSPEEVPAPEVELQPEKQIGVAQTGPIRPPSAAPAPAAPAPTPGIDLELRKSLIRGPDGKYLVNIIRGPGGQMMKVPPEQQGVIQEYINKLEAYEAAQSAQQGEQAIATYVGMLGLVKEALKAGDRKTAGRIMTDYSQRLLKDGHEKLGREAQIMAEGLLDG